MATLFTVKNELTNVQYLNSSNSSMKWTKPSHVYHSYQSPRTRLSLSRPISQAFATKKTLSQKLID